MLERYKYTDKEQKALLKSLTVLIDTREKENKHNHILSYFDKNKIPYESMTLTHGDYSCKIPADESLNLPRDIYFTNEICIERKQNLSEWVGNITADRQAVKKKFALAPPHTILMIENSSYADIFSGNYFSNYSSNALYASYHSIWTEFDIPIIFMPDPALSGAFIWGFFKYYVRNIIK